MRVSLSLRLWWIVAIAPNPPYRLIRRTAVGIHVGLTIEPLAQPTATSTQALFSLIGWL